MFLKKTKQKKKETTTLWTTLKNTAKFPMKICKHNFAAYFSSNPLPPLPPTPPDNSHLDQLFIYSHSFVSFIFPAFFVHLISILVLRKEEKRDEKAWGAKETSSNKYSTSFGQTAWECACHSSFVSRHFSSRVVAVRCLAAVYFSSSI